MVQACDRARPGRNISWPRGWPVYGADDPSRAVQALRAQAEKVTAHAAWTR
jgi:hypothetical protein